MDVLPLRPRLPPRPRGGRHVLAVLAAGTAYLLATRALLPFDLVYPAYVFYAASALAMATLLVLGPGAWYGVALGALLANALSGVPWPLAALMAVLQVLEALTVERLVRPWNGPAGPFRSLRGLTAFMGAAFLSNLAFSALLGPLILTLTGRVVLLDLSNTRVTWLMADMTGILCLVPILIEVVQPAAHRFLRWPSPPRTPMAGGPRTDRAESAGVVLLTGGLLGLAFGHDSLGPDWREPLRYGCLLPALWTALRLGLPRTALWLALFPCAAVGTLWLATEGRIPGAEFRSLQHILLMIAVPTLLSAVLVEEGRTRTRRALALLRRIRARAGAGRALPPGPQAPGPAALSPVVLIVDDDPTLREVARRVLEGHGYTILEAENGAAGLARWRAHRDRIGLVLLDLVMPGMHGFEVLDILHREDPALAILVCSGHAVGPRILEPGSGASGYLPKPFRGEDLLGAVQRLLPPGGAP